MSCIFTAHPVYAQSAQPNIVIVLADDQGWGDLSIHGNTNLNTPRIDSLAKDGVSFDRFYACPVCAPTRAEFLTGRYHTRSGVLGVSKGAERMNLDETTLGDVFKEAGYATGLFGKWHNGTQYPYHPNGQGFDEFYGFASGHWGNYFDPILEHNGELVRGKGFIIDDLTEKALQFIDTNKEKPFLWYLAYTTPHSPFQVPDKFYDRFANVEPTMKHRDPDKEDIGKTRAALAMVENIDWNVGRVLDKLDALGLSENTIVVFFSDNGPNSWRWNDGMKGRKGSIDEGGLRVPFFVRWPGKIPEGTTVPHISAAIDILPTLADLTGLPLNIPKPLDGISLKTLMMNPTAPRSDRMIFSHRSGRVSVRTSQYRLDHTGQLFDMQTDPGQNVDVANERPRVAKRLADAVEQWKQEALPKSTVDDRPFPIGFADFPMTPLPARDGTPHGNIQRSAGAPNCSFFTNWTSTNDRITWNVEVMQDGIYEVDIYYTCAPGNEGAELQLALGDASVKGTVTEIHDPPLYGKENDRVQRGSESYVKDFKAFRLGTVELHSGRGELVLRALQIPGKSAVDVRAVTLRLMNTAQ